MTKQRKPGEAAPIHGRKNCFDCNRWLLLVTHFSPSMRDEDGNVVTFKPRCNHCRRERWRRGQRYSPAAMERRREYDRIRQEAIRRAQGARTYRPRRRVDVGRSTERVPNAPIREAFLASNLTATDLARRARYTRKITSHGRLVERPDDGHVLRMLGLRTDGGQAGMQQTLSYHHAVRLVKAMGLLPVDFGV